MTSGKNEKGGVLDQIENENEDADLLERKEIKEKNYYLEVLKTNSLPHRMCLVLYILSLFNFHLMIFQTFIISRMITDRYNLTNLEMTFFIALTFLCIGIGIFLNNLYFVEYSVRGKIILCSLISGLSLLFIVIVSSSYLLYLCYPVIAILQSVIFFSVKQNFNHYYHGKENNSFRNFIDSLSPLVWFLCLVFYWLFRPNWNRVFILFLGILVFVIILSIFSYESPLYYYRNNDNDSLNHLFEKIKKEKLQDGELETLKEEMFSYEKKESSILLSFLFIDNYKIQGYVYYTVVSIISLLVFGHIYIGLETSSETLLLNKTTRDYFFFVLTSFYGLFLGSIICHFIDVKVRIVMIIHFLIITVLIIVNIFLDIIFIYGVSLAVSMSLLVVTLQLVRNIYEEEMVDKAVSMADFIFYFIGAIAVIISGLIYLKSNRIVGVIFSVFSLIGLLLSIFLDKELIDSN